MRILIFYSEYLNFLRESSGEHGSDAVSLGRHSVVDDLANLRLETHVQHSVRLVQHQVTHSAEADQTLQNEYFRIAYTFVIKLFYFSKSLENNPKTSL